MTEPLPLTSSPEQTSDTVVPAVQPTSNDRLIESKTESEVGVRNELIEPLPPPPEPPINMPVPPPNELLKALKWAVNAALILVILFIIFATWLPAIYTSNWFQNNVWVKTHLLQTTPAKK